MAAEVQLSRTAFRRDPIMVDLGDERVIQVHPIPWEQRNDFGNEVMTQHVTVINEAVKIYTDPESGAPQLEAKLAEKFTDPRELLRLGLLTDQFELAYSKPLYNNQIVEILLAICDNNGLEQLKPMIDPNLTTPMMLGGLLAELEPSGTSTPRTGSGLDSSSGASAETPSEPSPTSS